VREDVYIILFGWDEEDLRTKTDTATKVSVIW